VTLTAEKVLGLPYDDGEVYAIGDTSQGTLLATGTEEDEDGARILVAVAGSRAEPVPLDSFIRFGVDIDFRAEPERWHGDL